MTSIDSKIFERFEGLAQDIGNSKFDDTKGKYTLYLLNDFDNRYDRPHYIGSLANDMEHYIEQQDTDISSLDDIKGFSYTIRETGVIENVSDFEDIYSIKLTNSISFNLKKEYGFTPKEGDKIVLYGYIPGSTGTEKEEGEIPLGSKIIGVEVNNNIICFDYIEPTFKKQFETYQELSKKINTMYNSLPQFFKDEVDSKLGNRLVNLIKNLDNQSLDKKLNLVRLYLDPKNEKIPFSKKNDLSEILQVLEFYGKFVNIIHFLHSFEEIEIFKDKLYELMKENHAKYLEKIKLNDVNNISDDELEPIFSYFLPSWGGFGLTSKYKEYIKTISK